MAEAIRKERKLFGRRKNKENVSIESATIVESEERGVAKVTYKPWEKILMFFSSVALLGGLVFLISGVSLVELYLGEDGTQVGEPIGKIDSVVGRVKRKLRGSLNFGEIRNGDTVHSGDTLMSEFGASANVVLDDGSQIKLSQNTMFSLASQNKVSLSGFQRSTNVDVISGSVSGQASQNEMFLRNKGKEVRLASGQSGQQKVESLGLSEETKVFNQTAPGQERARVLMIYPENRASIPLSSLPNGLMTLRWNVIPAKPQYRVQLNVRQIQNGQPTKVLLSLIVEQKEMSQSASFYVKDPGTYEWSVNVTNEDTKPMVIAKSEFTLQTTAPHSKRLQAPPVQKR